MIERSAQLNNNILSYIPKRITNWAMLTYVAAIFCCNTLFASHMLHWQWWFFGAIEVLGFFYFANRLSKGWFYLKPLHFTQKIFWIALFLRALWVVVSYVLYQNWTGTAFTIGAGDELYYDELAKYAANQIRNYGEWNIYASVKKYSAENAFSDMGYPIYLTIIYWIFGNSIVVARLIKAVLGAWTVVLIYKLSSRNFGEQVGRITAIMCMLMPNLIYYCSFQLKEVEMVFLCILFAERADFLLRKGKLAFVPTAALMLIPAFMFMIRTALAAVMVMAFFCALLLSSECVVSWGRRALLLTLALVFAGVVLTTSTSIGHDIQQMWQTRGSNQQVNMEWRAERDVGQGMTQKFAKYAGAAVFAPMIFTIPFPTMNEVPNQENQKMIHGGNFVKNILSFFTIAALFVLLFSGDWRKYVLPLAILCGYLVVLVFSNFAQSERFHLPIVPFTLMFAAYGISKMNEIWWIKKYFPYWCALMFVAAIAWNWFKLAGRGMI